MSTSRDSESRIVDRQRRRIIAAGTLAFGGLGIRSATGQAIVDDVVSHEAETIHQQPFIAGSRQRVYRVLTDARRFDELTRLSAAATMMAVKQRPSEINPEPGGAFALFGGYITGRFLQLVPDELVVQAWRVGSWEPGIFSVVRFQLTNESVGTRIIFDHTGFPTGQADHLAEGWHANYWDPLGKLLA
jgi:activator of HSP90 ATPase